MAEQSPAFATIDQLTKLGDAYKQGEPGAREGLMDAAAKLQSQLMLPAEAMLMMQWAQTAHQAVLRLSMDIHLFDALASDGGKPKTSQAIAEKTQPRAEHGFVSRMLRMLASMHTITETDADTFAPTELARSLTDERFRDTVYFITDHCQPVHQEEPAYFAKTDYQAPSSSVDGPWQHAYDIKGIHYFEHFERVPLMGKRFANMMDLWSRDRPKWFQEGYYPVKERLIEGAKGDTDAAFLIDIGGGSGHDSQQLFEAFRDALPGKLVLQDRPEIVQLAKVASQIERMGHDFLTQQPVKGARAYYLHSIIQDWDDAINTQILHSIVPAMERGYSKILINDFVVPDQGAHWAQTSLDWKLMTSLAARHRTESEHRALIEGAGLRVVDIFSHPQSLDAVIEVELP